MIDLQGGDQPLELQLQGYMSAWSELGISSTSVMATTLSWKVANKAGLFWNMKNLSPLIEQMHVGTVNDRYIASMVLKQPIQQSIWVIKILERRPGSQDALGLDSLDYLVKDLSAAREDVQLKGHKIAAEHNDMHEWLSLRFGADDAFEAKFVDRIVLDVAIKELQLSTEAIQASIKRS